jgi:hypothetical protein
MSGLFGDVFAVRSQEQAEQEVKRKQTEAIFHEMWGVGSGKEVRLKTSDHQYTTEHKGIIDEIRSSELVSVYFPHIERNGGTWHIMNLQSWEGESPWKDGPIQRDDEEE